MVFCRMFVVRVTPKPSLKRRPVTSDLFEGLMFDSAPGGNAVSFAAAVLVRPTPFADPRSYRQSERSPRSSSAYPKGVVSS